MLKNLQTTDITTISKSTSFHQSLLPWNSMHISYENSMIISPIKKKAKQKLKKKLLLNKIILGFLYLILIIAHAFLDINLILLLLSSPSSSFFSSTYSIVFLFSFFGLLSSLLLFLSLLVFLLSLLLLLPSLLRPSLYLLSSSLSSLLACLLTFALAKEENEKYVWEWFGSIGGITLAMGITIWRTGNALTLWEEYNKKNKNDSVRKRLSY